MMPPLGSLLENGGATRDKPHPAWATPVKYPG
jgi:hypothetical protein